MARPADSARYSGVAITLHWLIAALIVTNFALAFTFESFLEAAAPADRQLGFQLIQFHKAAGLTVLALTVLRLLWRLGHAWPPLPAHMAGWERFLARLTHIGFYALTLFVPLLGWALVSASPLDFPISWFGLFDWPQLPLDNSKPVADQISELHEIAAFTMLGLLALHVAGALKHQWVDRDGVLGRMLPFARRTG